MRSVKLTTLRKSNLYPVSSVLAVLLFSGIYSAAYTQDNSPYSRYGLGDKFPNTNAANRAMGGISAAYNDYYNINFNNPASYSFFQAQQEPNSRKLANGRGVLNIGVDGQVRTLIDKEAQKRFPATDVVFSHVMVGMPLRKNWGMAFGLRPVHRINYKMERWGNIVDHRTNLPIDSGRILSEGQGGLYLASLGTGVKFRVGKSGFLSLGATGGYMFGKKDYSTRLTLISPDAAAIYAAGNKQTKSGLGGLYFDAGAQLQLKVSDKIYMGIGGYGNLNRNVNTSSDVISETYIYDESQGYIRRDSVSDVKDIKGSFDYPASVTGGFIIHKPQLNPTSESGWLFGVDFTHSSWDNYRINGQADPDLRSNWMLKIGTELNPIRKNNYFSLVSYRAGFFTGPDYVYLNNTAMPTYGVSFGVGLPLINYNGAMARYQQSVLNLGFEYVKRGNNDNMLQENLFRVSAGFSLSDLWFIKRRYVD